MKDIKSGIHLVVTNAWIKKGDKYLIAQRSKTDNYMPGYRGMIGGKLDYTAGYSALEKNIKKEILEEVGIEVEDNIKTIGNFMETTKTTTIYITFLCNWKAGEAKALEDTEQVKRLTINELKLFDEPNIFKNFLQHII